jgi:hypothetical protein
VETPKHFGTDLGIKYRVDVWMRTDNRSLATAQANGTMVLDLGDIKWIGKDELGMTKMEIYLGELNTKRY